MSQSGLMACKAPNRVDDVTDLHVGHVRPDGQAEQLVMDDVEITEGVRQREIAVDGLVVRWRGVVDRGRDRLA